MKFTTLNKPENALLSFFLILKVVLSFALVNPAYELHRDEYLHLDLGSHLAAGYTSVPPLTGFLSALIKELGGGFFWVRLFPAVFGALTIFYSWKTVRLLKGGLLACSFVAVACLCSALLRLNTLYQPNSFDVLAWTAVFYHLIAHFETGKASQLYTMAIWAAVGFLNKYNIVFLGIGLLPALLLLPQRRVFVNRHLYLALLLALVLVLPNLIWQVYYNFPVVRHMLELSRSQLVHVNRTDFLTNQVLYFINSIVFLISGLVALACYRPFRRHRWVLLTYLFTMTVFCYFRAKDYYALGLYPVLLSFGALFLADKLNKRPVVTGAVLTASIGSLILFIPFLMPLWSPGKIVENQGRFQKIGLLRWEDGKDHQLPQDFADMQGWRELAKIADRAYALVPGRSAVLVRANNYGQAGAINYYSKFKSMNCLSYNADYLYWFDLSKPVKHLILIREAGEQDPRRNEEQRLFKRIRKIGSVQNTYAREYGTSVYLLESATTDINPRLREEIKEELHDD
ncbi:glycosyltransferase family 39 protein [Pedobacter sp. SYP-B3415]|uniref:glycosyltransferase family 39 protein n=1 Tax=Pedobacter sp. SYP-B3415 TaxID=2496641 RepID=UPI00101DBBD2|nr:glycosyltransferase family 39 protein [Pedobacter sp. SYP-B3415]